MDQIQFDSTTSKQKLLLMELLGQIYKVQVERPRLCHSHSHHYGKITYECEQQQLGKKISTSIMKQQCDLSVSSIIDSVSEIKFVPYNKDDDDKFESYKQRQQRSTLLAKGINELKNIIEELYQKIIKANQQLLIQLKQRDRNIRSQESYYRFFTKFMPIFIPSSSSTSMPRQNNNGIKITSGNYSKPNSKYRTTFDSSTTLEMKHLLQLNSVNESGYKQWHNAMRMVARLPGGIPATFRRKLWLTLADRYIENREIDWEETCTKCFSEKNNPEDEYLSIQIVKDIHRTGCSLFNSEKRDNQALLKQVLLAYARFNQTIGYCQGFNMLAAILLEVMEGNVSHALKLMIYLIEDLLPEGYFTNNLRGLSVDMVVFRDLMHLKLPELASHLDRLQQDSYDPNLGIHYEPPLINAFTMQWFLTLFSNCLPKPTVMRIWDLIFLEGNEILLRTALVIWDCLSDRIMAMKSADEFYSIMDVLTREIIEFGPTNTNELITSICNMVPFPFPRLMELRNNYYYNISPFNASINQLKSGFVNMFNNSVQKLLEDDDEQEKNSQQNWFEDQIILLNWYLNNNLNNNDNNNKWRSSSPNKSPIHSISTTGANFIESILKQIQGNYNNNQCSSKNSGNNGPRSNVGSLDISLLKKQYLKLKQRQKQVQVILKEGFQYNQTETEPDKQQQTKTLSMAGLLSGKTPLINQLNHKESSINQLISREQFTGSIYPGAVFKRSNTLTSLYDSSSLATTTNITNSNSSCHLSNYQHQVDGKPTCDIILQIQPQIKITTATTTNSRNYQEVVKKKLIPRSMRGSSSSSTSTELCDEIILISNNNSDEDLKTFEIRNSTKLRWKPSSLNDIYSFKQNETEFTDDQQYQSNRLSYLDKEYDDVFDVTVSGDNDGHQLDDADHDDSDDNDDENTTRLLDETIRRFKEQINQVKIDE